MTTKVMVLSKSKLVLNSGLVQEIIIWRVPQNKFHPESIKYRLVLADPVWKKVFLLYDNYSPKGHHWHDCRGEELPYKFTSMNVLLDDFFRQVKNLEKQYENYEN